MFFIENRDYDIIFYMKIIILMMILTSCAMPPVISRSPSSYDNRMHCKHYSSEHLICKQSNKCFFIDNDYYEESKTNVNCNFYQNN